MEEVNISKFLKNKLNSISKILFEKEYFDFQEDSELYVQNIFDFIYTIPQKRHLKTKNLNMAFIIPN